VRFKAALDFDPPKLAR